MSFLYIFDVLRVRTTHNVFSLVAVNSSLASQQCVKTTAMVCYDKGHG